MRQIIIFCLSVTLVYGVPLKTPESLLDQVIPGVEKVLTFFGLDYSDINVDGLFGLRLGQGQLIHAVKECKNNPTCSDKYLTKIEAIEKKLKDICDNAIPYAEGVDEGYFQRFKETIDRPYLLSYTPTHFNKNDFKSSIGTDSKYDEEKGDACFTRIMGTFKENNKDLPRCNATSSCWDYMTSSGKYRYAITHQLLYFILIENCGCTKKVELFNHDNHIWDIKKNFCSNIYQEAKSLTVNGQVSSMHRDLFLEETVLCGSLGFEDFMREDWIQMVLQWPDKKEGCFKISLEGYEQYAKESVDSVITWGGITNKTDIEQIEKDAEEKAEQIYEKNDKESLVAKTTMRKLLREKTMKDNCLSHTSGLGFGSLATYLHYLVRYLE